MSHLYELYMVGLYKTDSFNLIRSTAGYQFEY